MNTFIIIGRGAVSCIRSKRASLCGGVRFFSEIKQFFKLFIKGYAEYQRKLGGGVELTRFDRTDGIAGNAHHICKVAL